MLKPNRFELTEHANQDKTITVEEGTKFDDVLKSEFYANVAPLLIPYDRIRVRTDTGAWYAELLVLSCGRNWAKVKKLFYMELATEDTDMGTAEDDAEYKVCFRGPNLKHSVIRVADKSVLKEGCETNAEAKIWLAEYLKVT